ncbi:tripartite tricarboxylate transporter substrate-binding protein [Profundibacter sp.]|uniref:tripartite tricarboxylate transporter substrate-binding protein n=1 Tax=Profundibacter sp. TaxID=3101071 RepID=UPI003D0CD216
MKRAAILAMTTIMAAATGTAVFADYPERPVTFIVPWPPGDLEDQLTRMIASQFQETFSSPAAVVNKPGGGGGPFPGAIYVAEQPADGYTIGSFVMGVVITGPKIGIEELSPNPFVPVGSFLTYPFVVATSKDAPYRDLKELAEYSQSHDVVLAHFGAGLIPTQMTFAMANREGITFASDSAFDAIDCNTLASGDADVINSTMQLLLPCIDDLNVLVSFTPERIPLTPDAPTLKEIYPDLSVELWNGLFVREGTDPEIIKTIADVARETVLGEEAQALAQRTGAFVYWQDAAQTAERIETDAQILEHVDEAAAQ